MTVQNKIENMHSALVIQVSSEGAAIAAAAPWPYDPDKPINIVMYTVIIYV
jgi:hypothetical protein